MLQDNILIYNTNYMNGYYDKYLKYKNKYLNLKKLNGGSNILFKYGGSNPIITTNIENISTIEDISLLIKENTNKKNDIHYKHLKNSQLIIQKY